MYQLCFNEIYYSLYLSRKGILNKQNKVVLQHHKKAYGELEVRDLSASALNDGVWSLLWFLDYTQLDTRIAGRDPLNELSARHKGCYLTTHSITQEKNVHAFSGIRITVPAVERPQNCAQTALPAGGGISSI
jgi:hypothetical protein